MLHGDSEPKDQQAKLFRVMTPLYVIVRGERNTVGSCQNSRTHLSSTYNLSSVYIFS